jgi:hypothetical protein
MLMRLNPFRERDRLTEQLASTAARAPRAIPVDAYHCGDVDEARERVGRPERDRDTAREGGEDVGPDRRTEGT